MLSKAIDLPDSPYNYPVDVIRTIPGTKQVVRFTVEFSPQGPKVIAALKGEEVVNFRSIAIADIPPFTASSKQKEVFATLRESAIACFHGEVHFLPDPLTPYKEWRAMLANSTLSPQKQKKLRGYIERIAIEVDILQKLLMLEGDSSKLQKMLFIDKEIRNASREDLLIERTRVYHSLGLKYRNFSNYRAALACLQHSLNFATKLEDKRLEMQAYDTIGSCYRFLGEYKEGIKFHQKGLELAQQLGDLKGESEAYIGLGLVYYGICEFRKAIEFHEKSLKIAMQINDNLGQSIAYSNLGLAFHELGEHTRAIEYHEKFLNLMAVEGSEKGVGIAYGNLGNAHASLGNSEKAIHFHNLHLEMALKLGDLAGQGITYGNLGGVYFNLEEYSKAIDFHQKHLKIMQEIGDQGGEGRAYNNLGGVYFSLRNYNQALKCHQESLKLAQQTGNLEDEGLAYGRLGFTFYSLQDYPSALGAFRKNLEIVNQLQKNNTAGNLQSGISYFETLYHPFRALEEILTSEFIVPHTTNPLDEALLIADSGRSRALVELLAAKTGRAHEPISLEQMQKIAAQNQTTFLLYSCSAGEETKAWVWVIPSQGEVTHHFLDLTPMKEELKTQETRPKHLKRVRGDIDFNFSAVTDWVTRSVITRTPPSNVYKLMTLWHECLIAPISDKLPKEKGARITIVPDAALGDLPFAIFKDNANQYLQECYTITTIPSIQVLAHLDSIDKKQKSLRDTQNICIVANPKLNAEHMLPGAEQEGNEVAKLFKDPQLFVQANATLDQVKGALPKAGIIHLACHGLTVDEGEKPIKKNHHSVFQGSFLLSDYNQLFAEDLMERPLNAELVVLSACNSGKGSLLKEGVVGPAHALLAAGTSTVIGTRWEIPDAATKVIIEKFYQFYLHETPESRKAKSEGRPFGKAEALREALLFAKQEVTNGTLSSNNADDPDFTAAWGAFFLVGLPDK